MHARRQQRMPKHSNGFGSIWPWQPSVDKNDAGHCKPFGHRGMSWFERGHAAKVRNMSKVGSHLLESITYKRASLCLYGFLYRSPTPSAISH
jgi:hypothetical protein